MKVEREVLVWLWKRRRGGRCDASKGCVGVGDSESAKSLGQRLTITHRRLALSNRSFIVRRFLSLLSHSSFKCRAYNHRRTSTLCSAFASTPFPSPSIAPLLLLPIPLSKTNVTL